MRAPLRSARKVSFRLRTIALRTCDSGRPFTFHRAHHLLSIGRSFQNPTRFKFQRGPISTFATYVQSIPCLALHDLLLFTPGLAVPAIRMPDKGVTAIVSGLRVIELATVTALDWTTAAQSLAAALSGGLTLGAIKGHRHRKVSVPNGRF